MTCAATPAETTPSKATATRAVKPTATGAASTAADVPKRAALYLRQSLDSTGKGLAVDRQRKLCEKFCKDRGWTIVHPEYNDNDKSASGKRVRPEFQKMLIDGQAGKFDVIVAYHVDRLTRSLNDYLPLLDLAEKHGVGVTTVSGEIDLTTDMGQTIAGLLAVIARGEIRRKGQRQKDANDQRAANGEPHQGGARPIGYDAVMEDKRRVNWVARESEAIHIRKAYADFLAGRSLSAIARDLNNAGVRTTRLNTKRGGRWIGTAVRQLLSNPLYAGLKVHRGEIVGKAAWDGLVDEATWRAACAILGDPARRTNPHGGCTRRHLGVSIYQCGVCDDGTTMVTHTGAAEGNQTRRRYQCRNGKHLMRAGDPIDRFVVDAVIERLSRPDAADVLVDHERPDMKVLQAEAVDLRTRLDDAAAAFADGEITRQQLRVVTGTLRARLTDLDEAMAHTDRSGVLGDLVRAEDKRAAWESFDLDRQRAIIAALCRVTIHKTRPGGDSRLSGADRPVRPGSVTVDFHV